MSREEISGEKLDTKLNYNPFRNKWKRCSIKHSVYRSSWIFFLNFVFQAEYVFQYRHVFSSHCNEAVFCMVTMLPNYIDTANF